MDPHASRLRFTVRGALLATGVLALGLAWFLDHARMQARLSKLDLQSTVQRSQIASLQSRLESLLRDRDKRLTLYWWSSADEFMDAFNEAEHDGDSMEMAVSLSRCEKTVLNESLKCLIGLLSTENERDRTRAVRAIAIVHQQQPERMLHLTDQIVSALIPLIDGERSGAAIHPIKLLGDFGPSAKDAISPLRACMMDDGNYSAPYAAHALAKIDPSVDVGPRLIEFVTQRKPERSWIAAAQTLADHIGPDKARDILMDTYERSENARDRRSLLGALNRIGVEAESTASKPPS